MIRHATLMRGFTLIEVLVAIAIFSVMSVFAYQGLRNFMDARAIVDAQSAEFARLVSGMTVLQLDFEEAAPRPVRDALGDPVPAMQSGQGRGEVIALTRHTAWAATHTAQSDLKRIEYRLQDGTLLRRVWSALDRVANTAFAERVVLTDVAEVGVRYFGDDTWQTSWPAADGAEALARLPAAVAITVRFADGRSVDRVIRVHGGG